MNNFEQFDITTTPTKENLTKIEETERKKQTKRENRLAKIVKKQTEQLIDLFPKNANDFEIVFQKITEIRSSLFEGEMTRFSPSDLPAYGIFLIPKKNSENKFLIEYWCRPDLDAGKTKFEMAFNQSFKDKIREGVKELS
jgi:hypothetical protein